MNPVTTLIRPTVLMLALAAAFPAAAQSSKALTAEELLKELQILRDRVTVLEQELQAQKAKQAENPPGMTPEQQAEFSRIATKAEATQDSLVDNGLSRLKLSGYIEPAFVYNQRQKRAGFQFLNQSPYGYSYDTSYIGAAVLDIQKETDSGTLWRLTLAPNRSAGMVVDGVSIVQEASVSVPIDGQIRVIAGQLPDWSGYEYMQPTLNPFTSHNVLFDFTLPTAYTGAGVEWKEGKWWVRTALANVNAPMRQATERSPAWAFRVDYAKGEFGGWGFASLIGKAPRFYDHASSGETLQKADMAVLLELDGWFTRGEWTLGGQLSYGQQKNGAIARAADGSFQDSQWYGVSGMVGYSLSPRLQLLARADYLNNSQNGGGLFTYNYADGINGIGPGQNVGDDPQRGANRYALTVGVKYLVNPNTTFKAEYRLDGADRAVFEDVGSGTYKKTNNMVATSMVVNF